MAIGTFHIDTIYGTGRDLDVDKDAVEIDRAEFEAAFQRATDYFASLLNDTP